MRNKRLKHKTMLKGILMQVVEIGDRYYRFNTFGMLQACTYLVPVVKHILLKNMRRPHPYHHGGGILPEDLFKLHIPYIRRVGNRQHFAAVKGYTHIARLKAHKNS